MPQSELGVAFCDDCSALHCARHRGRRAGPGRVQRLAVADL